MLNLNIREMIDGGPARLRYVFRYSTSRVEHQESVAEHSWFVAFYCMMVAEWVNNDPSANVEGGISLVRLLKRAILHDLEEARSGDFPRNFKHSTPELKAMLEVAAEHAFIQLMEPVWNTKVDGPPGNVVVRMLHHWTDSKDDTYEGRILEFADFLAVLGFMMQEGAHDGNRVIKQHVAEMHKYMAKFERPEFDFLRPLVQQASELTREIL